MLTRQTLLQKRAECEQARADALAVVNANHGAIGLIDWLLGEMEAEQAAPVPLEDLLPPGTIIQEGA